MATEAHIPEFISITKGEEEEKNLTKVQLDATSYENYPGELKNEGGALDDPPEIFECSEKPENMQVAKDINIETMSTVNKGNVGTSEGEIFLESPSVSKVAHEETSKVLDDYHAGEIPNQAEKEIFREENKLQKYQKFEDAETGEVESENKKDIKEGEDKVAHELGETGFVRGKDKEPEKPPILLSKENDPEAEQIERGIDEGNKMAYAGGQDVSMTTVAGSTEETIFQEAGIEEKSQDTMALSEKIIDMIPVEGDSQDQNELDIPFVTHTEDLGLQKVENPETLKEVLETGREDINIKEIPDEKNLPQVDSNEKFEIEEAEREKPSETYSKTIDYGLNIEGEIKEEHSGQKIDVEIQEKEEACDPETHKSATKSNDTEKGIKDEDVPARASDPTCIGNETIDRSFQVDYLDEVPSALTGDSNSNKAEDDVEKDNIIPKELHDEIKITGITDCTRELITEESDVTKRSPETIEEETVKSYLDGEKLLLADEKSRGEYNSEQAIADSVKGTQESNEEEFVDIEKQDEACKEEIFESSEMPRTAECVESEKIPDIAMVEPKESSQDEGENQVPVEDPTEGKRNDYMHSAINEDNEDIIGLSKGEENTEWISQKDETGEKLEQSLNAMSKVTEAIISSEYTENITSIKEEKAIQDVEEPFEKEEREDTKDSEEVETVSEKNLVPVAMVFEMSRHTENTVLELKSEKDEKPLNRNELAFEERITANDAREDTEEEIKKEETYDPASDEVETTCDGTEKSTMEEDAVIKDGNTVWIEEETVELSCQEDEDQQNGTEKTVLNLNGGDHSIRTDTETENSSDQIISKEIAAIIESTEKHTIDVSPQSSGEEILNFSQDETKEEGENPKAEICEELETTTIGEGIRGQILEGDTIQDHSTLPIEAEETKDNSKENEMMTKTPKPEVSEISQRYDGVQDIQKDIEEETTEGSKVEKNQEKPEREDKDSVEPGEKPEGAPQSVAKDLINEAILETNQMQIKENGNNVQDQKSVSVEELNIEHGLQKDEKDTYMEKTSRSDAGGHIDELQNADETISERMVDSSNTISEISEEINKEIVQEAETCYNNLHTATEMVETEEISPCEAQLDENSLQGTETSSEEKTLQSSAETSQQDEVDESVKLEETTELTSQLPVIASDNADKESSTVEKLHTEEFEETKGNSKAVFKSREQCVEETVDTQKTLNVEESEGIPKEEINGASETVTECNYQDVKEDIKDEIDVTQMDSAGKSEDRHQETCTALPSEERDLGITATIGYAGDGKEKEGETPQNENPEDSLAARTTEEICSPKEEARQLEIFGLGPDLNENIQHINPNEPLKGECITLDELPQLEPQENVSAIKYPKSPKESDTVMEVTEEEPKRVDKAAEESENIKEPIIEKEIGTDGFPAVSIEDESIDKEQHTEILSSLRVIDPEVQNEKVNLKVMEDFSKELEGSHVTNAMEEEMLQNQGGEKKVDISSSVSETSEEINKQATEGRDPCPNNIDTASAKVETEEISCREARLDDKQIQNIETGLKDITLQKNTTETSPQDEDVNIKFEETSKGVSQIPAIACENTDEESEIGEKPLVDEVEEITGASETVFESKEPCILDDDETQKRPTIEESEEGIIKEEIKEPSETVSSCNNQGFEEVVEDEIDFLQTTAVGASEEQHQETYTSMSSLLSEEQDLEITATIGCSEDGKAKEGQTPQNKNLEDSFPTKTTEEKFFLKEEPRELSGLGLELNENIQQINPNEPLKEECSSLDEVSQLKPQENVSALKHSISLKETDNVIELLEQVPKEVDKVAEESEISKELIIDNERCIKEFPAAEEDESINKEQHSETVPSDSPRVINSKVQTEESLEAVEDFSKDLEGSLITKTMEKKVNISSSIYEISEEANKHVIEGTDACSNNIDTTSEKVETEDTSSQEAQSDDREIKTTQSSSENKTLQTNNITETSSQDEVDNITLEETSEEVSQLPATNKESEIIEKPQVDEVEETKGASEMVSESREPLIEENNGMQKRLTVQESEGISKEAIKGPSDIVFGSTNQGVEAAVEDETKVFQVATMGKSEKSHQETSKALLSEEQDHSITVAIGCLEDVIAKKYEKKDMESSFATMTKEVCLQKEEPRELEISGLGQDTNDDVQKHNPNEPPREEFNVPTEAILLEMDENCHKVSKIEHGKIEKVSDSVFEVNSNVVEITTVEMEAGAYNHGSEASTTENNDNITKEAPEAKKLVDSENIEKLMTEKQGDIEEPATISVDDESFKVQHVIVPGENLREADLNTQIEKVNQDVVKDFSQDPEGSPIIKALEEQMPQVEDSEQTVDISGSVYEISKETASEKVETEETSMRKAQLNDKHIKIIETSSEDKELQTKTTFETCPEDDVSSLQPQENIYKIKCTDPPVESDGVMELTNQVPEVAEKVVKRENIKELIMEKERDIKELSAVYVDESVTKVQVVGPISNENLGVTDTNMQTENLNFKVEDLSKEPKGSSITKALEEEMLEEQDDEKAMNVHSSISEMQEENINEVMEKADIPNSKLDTASEKGEIEESSSEEAQLDDEALKIIESSSKDKALQTNSFTENSPQAEGVDSVKHEQALELVSQLPAHAFEDANKESETVENPHADEIEETKGASTVSESREQRAEEKDETQNRSTESEVDIIKEQIKGASEIEPESKHQVIESVSEGQIAAGQAIKAEKLEEQLEEVFTTILSKEQEHGINTIIGNAEDENIKEGETSQYENPEDSFNTGASEKICLQKEEPRKLVVSGLGLEINEDVLKEDGTIVDGVSQSEQQENISETTKNDENLDSGIILTNSPCENILHEVGENCEEASTLECENFEKVSEPVLDLHSTEIDEAVAVSEAGAHIEGSDASNTKTSENIIREVRQGAEKSVEGENIKELNIEKDSDTKELPTVSTEDETFEKAPEEAKKLVDSEIIEKLMMEKQGDIKEPATISVDDESVKVQHDIIPGENLRAADLNTQIEKVNQDVVEDFCQDPEGSPNIKALEEQMPQVEDSELTVDISSSVYEISKETASEKVETEETSLQKAQLNDKHIKVIETSSEDKELQTKTTFETCSEDDVSSLQPQEYISKIKCTDPPVESDGVMELTNEVPEVTEKVVKRENIKELIIEKERDIKELSAVYVDESVIKVQVVGPIPNENLGVTDTNMQIENLNFKVEDLSKEPKGSSFTKALEEEMSEKQDDEKAMNVHNSISEMQEEIIKVVMEKADIPNNKLDTASEKGETEELSSEEAQLDDKALKIIESSSKDKALQTNTFTENSPQAEGVDSVKHEQALKLVSQLPAHAFDNANKESETVENPHADEIEETKGASTVSESREQHAEEKDETQNRSTEAEVDIIKEQIKGASEIEPESKYQVIESVSEGQIAAGQAIKAEKIEEQLEEVSTTILSKEQEHGINTIIGNAEDENRKEGKTSQYENPEDSFNTGASEKICLQKEEPRKLVVSGLGLEINEDVLKEDGTIVDRVSQSEQQENISETTKNDENLDSGIILTNSPCENILHEVGENCEEASTLECENFEKVSEPVLDLHSTEIDEAVAVLEAGAHIQGSDASNTKKSENIIREVPQGAEKSVECENIKELNIERDSDTKELPTVSTEDETFEKTETMNLEVKDAEGSPISETLQEEISQKQASEKTVEVTNSVSEMPEEIFKGETINEVETCCSKLDTTSETVVTIEMSLQQGQLDDKPLKGIDTSAAEKITTIESSLQSEEIDSLKFDEASALKARPPTVAFESADKDKKIVENPDADEVGEPEGLSHTVSETRDHNIEKIVETQESPALEKSEENIIKEEIKVSSEIVSECTSPSSEAFAENEISANQTIEAEKPKEQLQEFKALEESKLEIKDDVWKKTINEELKEGDNALYRITLLEPQENDLEIKCQDSLEGDMELARSMGSSLQEGTKDDKDLDSGIFIKNVDDALPPYSSGEKILQAADENYEEPSNFEGEKIEKSSESMSRVHSDEVDKAATDLEAGSHKHGNEASNTKNNDNITEKNIELADINEKLGGTEGQCNETLPETNQKQVVENSSSADEQNTKSIEEQIIGQGLQEYVKETNEETESNLESCDHSHVIQNENETIKDVISVEEVSGGTEKAEERENIQEHIIEEKKDNKELLAVTFEDKTIVKEKSSEPASCESFREAESNHKTRELNLEDEEDLCEKPVDVSSPVFELSEKGVKGVIIDEAENYDKLDTAFEKVEAEKTVLWEPQLDDEPLKGIDTALEEKTPQINKPTETILGDEETEAVKLAKISDLVAQLPTTTYEHAHKESVIFEEPQVDEVQETKRAFNTTAEFRDPCIQEIDETQRSPIMENLKEQKIEEEITGKSRELPKAGNSREQHQEMSIAMPSEEEPEITTTIGKSEAENKKENETLHEENLEDYLGTGAAEEKCLQKVGLRELDDSALTAKHSNVIQKESSKEALKEEGKAQENVSGIIYLDSTTAGEQVMKLTMSIDSSSQEASKDEEILDSGNSNNTADNFSIPHSSVEILEKIQEECEKTPNIESDKIEKAPEYASEFHCPEAIIKLEEPEVKEEHLKTLATEVRAEEILHEKTIEANEKIAEERHVAEDHQPESLDEETIRKSLKEDELKNVVEYDELYEESKASDNIEKQIIDDARTIEHPPLASCRDESVNNNPPQEAKGERNDKEADIKLDLVNQSDGTAISKQADCSDIQLMKKDLDVGDAFDNKAVVITKDEDLKPNSDVPTEKSASKEEASHQKEVKIEDVSESVSQELVHETTRRNEEIATAINDYSENFMENKLHIQTPHELACKEHNVSEGLKLKDPEVGTSENDTSPLSETSWEEIPGKESVISDEERQHDLTSGKQIIAESISTEEKGANDEAKHTEDKGKHTQDEEPREFLAGGSEGKLEEAEIYSTTDGAIQSQTEKLSASSQVKCSDMEISEKEVHMDLEEANESTQDNKQLEKGADETSKKHIPREEERTESMEVMISSGKEGGVHLASEDPLRKTFQKPEVESQEAIKVSGIESEVGEKDCGGEETMGDISEEPDVNSMPMDPAVSLSDLLQKSIKETLQAPGCLTSEKEPMAKKEHMTAKEEEATEVQEAETHEGIDEEEEGDEHKKDDSGSDAPVIVEASRDVTVKDGHKKSHNILSGVGSKVKHSIAKVKKAITGKSSSHHKHSSPKETAAKAKEQK